MIDHIYINTQDTLDRILQLCFESIESGQETIDTLLGRYSSSYDALRPALEAAAWLYNHTHLLNPHPGFVDVSRRRLVYQVCQERTTRNINLWNEPLQLLQKDVGGRRKQDQPSLVVTLIAFLLIINSIQISPRESRSPVGLLTE